MLGYDMALIHRMSRVWFLKNNETLSTGPPHADDGTCQSAEF